MVRGFSCYGRAWLMHYIRMQASLVLIEVGLFGINGK